MTAEGQPRQTRGTAGVIAPPPVIYLAFLGLGFAFERLMPGAELPGWAQWIGAVVIVAGVALMISFELAFKRAGTDANPYRTSRALATDGPYRFSRNPAYLGMAITYVGITLAAEAPWALLMLAPATLVLQYGVIAREERYLERLFGEDYLTYKRTTRRWICPDRPLLARAAGERGAPPPARADDRQARAAAARLCAAGGAHDGAM